LQIEFRAESYTKRGGFCTHKKERYGIISVDISLSPSKRRKYRNDEKNVGFGFGRCNASGRGADRFSRGTRGDL
jgi:hypothetical protein